MKIRTAVLPLALLVAGCSAPQQKDVESAPLGTYAVEEIKPLADKLLQEIKLGDSVRADVLARLDEMRRAAHERHAGRLDGDIGPRRKCEADIGRRQRGGIVDTVTGHGDNGAGGLQFANDAVFVLRRHVGMHLVDADLPRDRFGGAAAVAGEHDHPDSLVVEGPDGLGGGRLDRIGHR